MSHLIMAGGLARTLQFMEILDSGESSAYIVSKGSSSNMGPKPVASSETQIYIFYSIIQAKKISFTYTFVAFEIMADCMNICMTLFLKQEQI